MKTCYWVFATIIFSYSIYCQELQWFGPRAGLGVLSESGKSSMKDGVHSPDPTRM